MGVAITGVFAAGFDNLGYGVTRGDIREGQAVRSIAASLVTSMIQMMKRKERSKALVLKVGSCTIRID